MGYFYYDYTYFIFVIPALIISMIAQAKVQSVFRKYSGVYNTMRLTGSEAASRVLYSAGISAVRIESVSGNLTDHFDPKENVIRLSDPVHSSASVAAVGVAAHEAGHAVQYAEHYGPLRFRQFLIPVTRFGSYLAVPLVIVGLLLPVQYDFVISLGILFYSFSVLLELVTLPVEFNASSRAIRALEESGMLYGEELAGAKKVLRAAAITYLAATFSAILFLLRLLILAGNRRGRR